MNLTYYEQLHETGVPVIVDAAASFGVTDNQVHFGKGFPGSIVFSFHATKPFGVGEGGLIYSANTDLISRIRQAENFGFTANRESVLPGLNGKISEYTAAMALSTLEHFDQKIKTRQQIYKWYLNQLQKSDCLVNGWSVQQAKGDVPYQFMTICCPDGRHNGDIIQLLASRNIEARTYFSPPCHRHPLFAKYPHTPLPVTDRISGRILSLPLWEEMSEQDVRLIVEGMLST